MPKCVCPCWLLLRLQLLLLHCEHTGRVKKRKKAESLNCTQYVFSVSLSLEGVEMCVAEVLAEWEVTFLVYVQSLLRCHCEIPADGIKCGRTRKVG